MRASRHVFWGYAVLFALLLLFVLGTSGCKATLVQQAGTKILKCATKINVDPTNGVAQGDEAVYVCNDSNFKKVTWKADQGVTFTVHFPGACPFNPCPDITDANPVATVGTLPFGLTVYKYTITVNNKPFDPHVVGGGG
jgi:hypothetical protein